MSVQPPVVLKLGGELIETPERVQALARAIVALASRRSLVVVHGAGREIDAALVRAGIAKRQVEGLRITDAPTLDVVVSVLAGLVNTRLVAAIEAAGGRAVGLTGADALTLPVVPAAPHRTAAGDLVDLELVGEPAGTDRPPLIDDLLGRGYTPVLASIGCARDGQLFNVNADTMAAALAGRIGAGALLLAGTTAGVLDAAGGTIPRLAAADVDRLIAGGQATAGMVAKLRAGLEAQRQGVSVVAIADGRTPDAFADAAQGLAGAGRTLLAADQPAPLRKETESTHVGR